MGRVQMYAWSTLLTVIWLGLFGLAMAIDRVDVAYVLGLATAVSMIAILSFISHRERRGVSQGGTE